MRGGRLPVVLDVSPGVHGRGGIGRYALELATALANAGQGAEYTLFYNRAGEAAVPAALCRLPRLTTHLGDRPWRLRVLLGHLLGRPDDSLFPGQGLFHATDHLLPRLGAMRSAFTLHDLAFRFHPETHATLNRWFLALMMPRFLRAADGVIAVSESTRRDAVRLYGLDEARMRVIPEGVGAHFRPLAAEELAAVRTRHHLPPGYILHVGTIEPRKNLERLLEAYHALRAAGEAPKLAIAGRRGWHCEGFFRRRRELGLEEEVILLGHVAEEDLPTLYGAAALLAFPSLYEGFGLPVLEAMACGTPVVAGDTSSVPEVAGDAALLVSPHDTGALAGALRRALTDGPLRATMRARGLARAERFTWARAAAATSAFYEELAGAHSLE